MRVSAAPQALRASTQLPAIVEAGAAGGRYEETTASYPGLRRGVIYSAIAFSSLIAIMLFFTGRGPESPPDSTLVLVPDGSPEEILEMLTIESVPPGATVIIDGRQLAQVTPTVASVPVNSRLDVQLRLDGFEEYTDVQILVAGKPLRLAPNLKPFVASLSVTTTPKGALVTLDGQELGVTPFGSSELRPGKARKLVLSLKDHRTIEVDVDLVRDQPTNISKTLKSTLQYGYINIHIRGSWAQISENGKALGDAPKKNLKLRVGVHRLKLYNPASGKQKDVRVEVFADRVKTYTFDLPSE